MPALSKAEAIDRLAERVQDAGPSVLSEYYTELFPSVAPPATPIASEIAQHIRKGLESEEVVDLWNVVFPADREVWYDEMSGELRFNEEMGEFAG